MPRWGAQLVPARLVSRLNRFVVEVCLQSGLERAHLANSGRLEELLSAGSPVWLLPRQSPGRSTRFDVVLVENAGQLVSLDARLPGQLVAEALPEDRLVGFRGWRLRRREPRYGSGRFDLELQSGAGQGGTTALVETKSVTLVVDTRRGREARFPDAPTARGRRHLQELTQVRAGGMRAAVIFVVGRADAVCFTPNSSNDPAFALALAEARAQGVELYAYSCRVTLTGIELAERLPVRGVQG